MAAGSLLAVAPVRQPGGAETTLLRLLAALRARGWAISLATPGPGRLRDAAPYPWHPLPLGGLARGAGARALGSWPRARSLAGQVDVVYLNGTVCGRLLPAVRRARTVLHIHDVVTRAPAMWRLADVVIAASGAVARALRGLRPHVVYPPVALDPPVAPAPWAPDGGPMIGYVGRIEPRKGALDLVRAAPAIRAGAPGARIVLMGDDDYAIDPAYLAAVRASGEVEHLPWVDNAPGVMRHLDVLVAPSRQEPFGTVLAEAMAVGTPVVATRVGGLPEVVEDGVTGALVAPADPGAIAAGVLRVLARRDEMGGAARRSAARFDPERHADAVERLIAA